MESFRQYHSIHCTGLPLLVDSALIFVSMRYLSVLAVVVPTQVWLGLMLFTPRTALVHLEPLPTTTSRPLHQCIVLG
jgi:hypothetical protein